MAINRIEIDPRRCGDPPRTAGLNRYWNDAYARRYAELMTAVRSTAARFDGGDAFVWAVARSAYKLMAYKDEYEVARLYSDGRFREALAREFEGTRTVRIHLAPPLFARTDPLTGRPRKMTFGSWILPVFGAMAALKGLREGPFDVFGRSAERRLERALRDAYLGAVYKLVATLSLQSLDDATALARAPLDVRGFGQVKEPEAEALLNRLQTIT
jgi:indolepyruvate ferredoxin oxidoreductase